MRAERVNDFETPREIILVSINDVFLWDRVPFSAGLSKRQWVAGADEAHCL
jgi:hypothetical protein